MREESDLAASGTAAAVLRLPDGGIETGAAPSRAIEAAEPMPPSGSRSIDAGFSDLLSDVADALASSLPEWRVRLGEAAARWQADGVATAVLERALRLAVAPDVDGLLATFAAAVARLRALETEAVALDASLAGDARFRDPERTAEAHALVARLRRERAARPPLRVDPECWVAEWPDVVALLIEDA